MPVLAEVPATLTAQNIVLPIVVALVVLALIALVVFLVRRSAKQQQRDGEVSEARRRQRDEQQP